MGSAEVFAGRVSDQGSASETQNKHMELNSKRPDTPVEKWAEEPKRRLPTGDTRWSGGTDVISCRGGAGHTCPEMSPPSCAVAVFRKAGDDRCWRGCGEGGPSCTEQPLWKMAWRLLGILHPELAFDPAAPPPGTRPEKTKTLAWKDTCTHTFIPNILTYGSNLSAY